MVVVNEVDQASIEKIAEKFFGPGARVISAAEIRPTVEHGVLKICGCNANVSYIVSLTGHREEYVFRFSRSRREDRFDHERRMYQLVQTNTDIPTPRIHAIDRSRSIAPTTFMIMDYMAGDAAEFLWHPQNPITSPSEKEDIGRRSGRCCAALHGVSKPAEPNEFAGRLLSRLDQLRDVVRDGQYAIPVEKLDRCGEAITQAPHLRASEKALCLQDSELFFTKTEGEWRPAFLCDTEWMDFGDPYLDLALRVCAPQYFWELTSPLSLENAEEVLERPFFQGYAETREIDVERLRCACLYYHFAGVCSILDGLYRPEKREGAKAREPVCAKLVDHMIESAE
ncbi:MAG: aminoglycoside phosphotransferase family protein [Planctomycetota bacterium]|jgi:aminoglycoside phosphotransferase (APT) family kinase protein|nr:aminoglycoside phosphotransferase family protein [Planctomycetota bacterium]MDP6502795.1 aminoglycoside phosphotransferase family protein [Planctomycetota bacterium]